jgi:RNA polymerase sigma-70 factor (ECF subfamily)
MDPGVRLMDRVRARDATAFEALYDGYHRLVFGIGLRMLGDPAMAEDLTQNVFLKVWTSPDAFRGGSFVAWVSRVARNRALDILRSRAVHPETDTPLGTVKTRIRSGLRRMRESLGERVSR